jgi:hypothetical protein
MDEDDDDDDDDDESGEIEDTDWQITFEQTYGFARGEYLAHVVDSSDEEDEFDPAYKVKYLAVC